MNHPITDEQLARYMSGLSSSEETQTVLDSLAEDDEQVEDFLNIVESVEMQLKSEKPQRPTWFRWQYWSAAAAVLLIMGGAVLWMMSRGDVVSFDSAPDYATQDSIDSDTLTCEELPCLILE